MTAIIFDNVFNDNKPCIVSGPPVNKARVYSQQMREGLVPPYDTTEEDTEPIIRGMMEDPSLPMH